MTGDRTGAGTWLKDGEGYNDRSRNNVGTGRGDRTNNGAELGIEQRASHETGQETQHLTEQEDWVWK